jgi:two-component system cell cycle sensor histidine kinase/response regulator CckA
MVLLVAAGLVAAAIGLLFVGKANAESYILTLLAALAVVGVFSLFAGAAGILRFGSAESSEPLRTAVSDGSPDGILVTNAAGPPR